VKELKEKFLRGKSLPNLVNYVVFESSVEAAVRFCSLFCVTQLQCVNYY